MAKKLDVEIGATEKSGTSAVFAKMSKAMKGLATEAQAFAVALSKTGDKQASIALSHMAMALNKTSEAFVKGGKEVGKYASAVDKAAGALALYEKELLNTEKTVGKHANAVKTLGKKYGTVNAQVKNWLPVLKKVEQAGMQLTQQFTNQNVALEYGNRKVKTFTKSLSTASIAEQVLSKNVRIVNGEFKILNREGLLGFKNLTEEGARSLGMLDKSFGRLNVTLSQTQAWNKAKRNYTGSAKRLAELNAKIKANPAYMDRATAALNRYNRMAAKAQKEQSKLGKGLAYLGNKFKSFTAYTAAAAATAAILGTTLKTLTINIDYSQALKDLEAITGATTKELELMDEMIRKVAGTTKFSATEIAAGMKMLGQSGFSASESIQAMESVANLATGTLSSMSTSVEIVTTALRVYKLEAAETAKVADIFTNAVNNSKLTIEKIKTALNYLGPITEAAGMSLADTTTTLMVLANAGVRASSSATGLRRVMKELINPSDKMKQAMLEAGYVVDDFSMKSNSMETIIGNLSNVVGDAGDSMKLFGLRGSTVASALVSQGAPAFREMYSAVQRQGTAAKNAAIQVEGLGIKFKQIKDKAANLALAIGDSGLTTILKTFAEAVGGSLVVITKLISNPLAKWVLGVAAAFLTLWAAQKAYLSLHVAEAFMFLTTEMNAVTIATKAAAAAQWLYNAAIGANPYVAAAVAIVALIVVFASLHKTTEELLAVQQKLFKNSSKNVIALDSEIKAVEDFNGTANDKLKLLDDLVKAYPQYATEIYKTRGEADDLLEVLRNIQKVEKEKTYKATTEQLKLYAKQLKSVGSELKLAKTDIAHVTKYNMDSSESYANLSKVQQKYNKVVSNTLESIRNLRDSGKEFSVEDFFPKNIFGEVKSGYRDYVKTVKEALAARDSFEKGQSQIGERSKALVNEINLHEEKIKNAELALEIAKTEEAHAKNRATYAKDSLALLRMAKVDESKLHDAKVKNVTATKDLSTASREVDRLSRKILANESSIHDIKLKHLKLEYDLAKFYGNSKVTAVAKENQEYQNQLVLISKLAKQRLTEGADPLAVLEETHKKQEIAYSRHEEKIKEIEFKYALESVDLKKRIEEAKVALVLGTDSEIEKKEIAALESKKHRSIQELNFEQERLDTLLANEKKNTDKIKKLVGEIEEKKKELYDLEQNLIHRRDKLLEDSYKKELALVKERQDTAKFYGNAEEVEIQKEAEAFKKEMHWIKKRSRARVEEGQNLAANVAQIFKETTNATERHEINVEAVHDKYAMRYNDLTKRTEQARQELVNGSKEEIKKAGLTEIENQIKRNKIEIILKKNHLDKLLSQEIKNKEAIYNTDNEILALKKRIYAAELILIKGRTKTIKEAYDLEILLINRNRDLELKSLEQRYARGSMSEDRYNRSKLDKTNRALVLEYTAAVRQSEKLNALEGASIESKIKARQKVVDIQNIFYNQEVDHAADIRTKHKEEADATSKEIDAETSKREQADKKRRAMVASFSAFISGLYTGAANALSEISAKAVDMAGKGNEYFDAVAASTRNSTDELVSWNGKVDDAKKKLDAFEQAGNTAWGGWGVMYRDLAKKWKVAVEASKEKVRFIADIRKLEATEINDLTNIEGIQSRLNSLKSDYKYLGEADLKNLFAAKKAMQEQINQQRTLNAEKNSARMDDIQAKLDEAKAAGVDISEYSFDKESASRMEVIKKEQTALEAKVAKQEYSDALALQALEVSGATEAQITLAREDAEKRIEEMRSPQKLLDLELKAISSKLNIEQLNLTIINDLKIKQFEEALAREEEIHQKRLEDIAIENEARMQKLQSTDAPADPSLAPEGLKMTSNIHMSSGGKLPGDSKIDSIPVLARPGEWFIRNESADHWTSRFGAGFMNGINKPLSSAGKTISSALSKVGNASFPAPNMFVPAPKLSFAGGGAVPSVGGVSDSLSSKLDRLIDVLNRNENGDTITNNISVSATELTEDGIRRVVIPVMERIQKRKH